MSKDIKIQENLRPLYDVYAQYKALFEFYQLHKNPDIRPRKQLEERIEYIKKNKVNQRNEIETIMWILDYDAEYEKDYL